MVWRHISSHLSVARKPKLWDNKEFVFTGGWKQLNKNHVLEMTKTFASFSFVYSSRLQTRMGWRHNVQGFFFSIFYFQFNIFLHTQPGNICDFNVWHIVKVFHFYTAEEHTWEQSRAVTKTQVTDMKKQTQEEKLKTLTTQYTHFELKQEMHRTWHRH